MHTKIEGAIADRPSTVTTHPKNFSGRHVHMIGIGGCGMSGAAALLHDLGAVVSGSDLAAFDGLGPLVQSGVRVAIGHHETQLSTHVELVVVSAAVPDTNPELTAARRRGLPVVKYAQLLGELTTIRKAVAIAGTHGKSTTTGMCVHLFHEAGLSPSFIIGARSAQLGGSSGVGGGPHFIVESCEFDRSFLYLQPHLAAILNIESDHLDCYRDLDDIVDAFSRFAENVAPDGVLLCNAEDRRAVRANPPSADECWTETMPLAAASAARCPVETFGFSDGADWQACNLRIDRGRYGFDVYLRGARLFSTGLSIPGRHNVANALAAIALAYHAGAEPERIAEALFTFSGVDRRLSWRAEGRGVTIVDDYAHHPTEIRVTIEAARDRYRPRRLWVVFQPHQDSRTRYFMDQFAESFGQADEVIVPEVYRARDSGDPLGQAGSAELALRIRRAGGRAHYIPTLVGVVDHLMPQLAEGDLVLTMGAGDVWTVADELVERLCGSDRVRCSTGAKDVVSPGWTCPVFVPAA